MDLYTIDFETFYSKQYSLTKMTSQEYVEGDEFEIIGVSIKKNNEPAVWHTYEDIDDYDECLEPLKDQMVLAHNAAFDLSILYRHFRIKPKLVLDTLSMSKPLHGLTVGGSLKALAEKYSIGVKGTEVLDALGKRRKDFTAEQLAAYGDYCINDVELTHTLFGKLRKYTTQKEMQVIDKTIRMATEPCLELDIEMLKESLDKEREAKKSLIKQAGIEQAELMSNPKFAKALETLGVTPPKKISPTTGKETFAFAKSDKDFTALLEHPDERVRALVEARVANKSTLNETRMERLIRLGELGPLRVPLGYCGAVTTWRWSGQDGLNLQNLPSRGDNTIRRAIKAPAGYKLVVADSSNIELRTNHCLAGQTDTLELLRAGEDLYKDFASTLYSKPIGEVTKDERFIGKVCVAEGTNVLCKHVSGTIDWVPIEDWTPDYQVWDGKEWVCPSGLANNGLKKTLNLSGLWLTPDHLVWSGTTWKQAGDLKRDANTLSQGLAYAVENLPSQVCWQKKNPQETVTPLVSKASLLSATVGSLNTLLTSTTSRLSSLLGVTSVLRKPQQASVTGNTQKPCRKMPIEQDYLIDSRRQFGAATVTRTEPTQTMAAGELQFVANGVQTEPRFSNMLGLSTDGTFQSMKWIASTLTATMNRAISALFRAEKTCSTNAESKTSNNESRNLKPVYDLTDCGPLNRFTVMTEDGPLIVHNCHLSLGYGCGWKKFKEMLRISGTHVDDGEAEKIVSTWRNTYTDVVKGWRDADKLIAGMNTGTEFHMPHLEGVYSKKGILITPPKHYIRYPELKLNNGEYSYKSRRGRGTETVKLYGGKVVENLCQHLSRNILAEQLVTVSSRYQVAMMVHDEFVCVVREDEADDALEWILEVMSTSPDWWPEIPLAAEGDIADRYGDAK